MNDLAFAGHRRRLSRDRFGAGRSIRMPCNRLVSTTHAANVRRHATAHAHLDARRVASSAARSRRRVAATAGAALPFAPCTSVAGFSCTSLTVPLDRSGKTPGTITLPIERKSAGTIQTQSAVIALAGGPGPGGDPARRISSPRRSHRRSAHATCSCSTSAAPGTREPAELPDLQQPGSARKGDRSTLSSLVELCALQIGPARGSVHDRRNRSKTSRRSATRRATRSSSCTAPPTARRSRSSTPNATRSTSKRSCSTRSCRPTGPKPFGDRPRFAGDRAGAHRAVLATAPAPASPPTRSANSRS